MGTKIDKEIGSVVETKKGRRNSENGRLLGSKSHHQTESEDFTGQVAVVTGAASGIGHAISQKLLTKGACVIALDLDIKGLGKLVKQYPEKIEAYKVDVTDESNVTAKIKDIILAHKKIDILINCAGITGKTGIQSHKVNSKDLSKVFEVNFMSCFFTSKAVIPYMLKSNYGRILHVSSISGKEGNAGMLAYSASKAAVACMAKVQGKEYAESGITVNAIAPAVIRTPLVENMPEKQVIYMTDKIPMKRCGTLEEIANAVAFIVSAENSFTTGFTFDLSGGRATY